MAPQQPENAQTDHPVEDSGIHVRDTERAPASAWQIVTAAVLVVAILCVFFYGITNQRVQVAGSTPPPPTQTNVPQTEQLKQNVGTTGQAPTPENPQEQPKAAAPQPKGGDQNTQPPAGTPGAPSGTAR